MYLQCEGFKEPVRYLDKVKERENIKEGTDCGCEALALTGSELTLSREGGAAKPA